MTAEKSIKNRRKKDPYLDRRSGKDRREAYSITYFSNGGLERRQEKDRRTRGERREGWVSVSEWSSICLDESDATKDE